MDLFCLCEMDHEGGRHMGTTWHLSYRTSSPQGQADEVDATLEYCRNLGRGIWSSSGVWPGGFPQFIPPSQVFLSCWVCVAGRPPPHQVTTTGKNLQAIKKFKQVNYFQKENKRIKMASVGTFKIQFIIYLRNFVQQWEMRRLETPKFYLVGKMFKLFLLLPVNGIRGAAAPASPRPALIALWLRSRVRG